VSARTVNKAERKRRACEWLRALLTNCERYFAGTYDLAAFNRSQRDVWDAIKRTGMETHVLRLVRANLQWTGARNRSERAR